MKRAATKTKASRETFMSNLSEQMAQRLREGLLICTAAIAVYLLLALATYNNTDPGWSFANNNNSVQNAGGRVGAWFADVFLYVFGYSAFLLPFLLSYAAWIYYRQRLGDFSKDVLSFGFKALGFVFIFMAASGLSSLYLQSFGGNLPYSAGGILGSVMGPFLLDTFSVSGTSLFLVALLLTGVTFFTGFSWLAVSELLGRGILTICQAILNLLQSFPGYLKERAAKQATSPAPSVRQEPVIDVPRIEPVAAVAKRSFLSRKKDAPKIEPVLDFVDVDSVKAAPAPVKRAAAPIIAMPKAVTKAVVSLPITPGDLPSLDLLDPVKIQTEQGYTKEALEQLSREVELRLKEFGVEVRVVAVQPGPVITRFELDLAPGVKASKISGLAKDLARSLSVISVRVVEVIPGKSVVGIEIPNQHRNIVQLRDVLESVAYQKARSPLSMALGHDIGGNPVVVDLAKMPHLLVAGTTGAGKSVGLNAMLLSILYKATPQQVRMILIDPKMLELSIYDGIPHLLAPVVTDMKDAANALRWCVAEMDRRYRLMAVLGVRNLAGYNVKIVEAQQKGHPIKDPFWQAGQSADDQPADLAELPFIVVLVDEFADMMMVVGKKVEELIARIAQKARAAGIHLILATQRPSVDVITGLIKANVPTRIAFQVSSRIDSRTILDQQGAEQLLGHGDMLYLAPGTGVPSRVHGAYVADQEVHNVVDAWKQKAQPDYIDEVLEGGNASLTGIPSLDGDAANNEGEQDALYDQAVRIVTETRRASISNIQRRLKIGYNRAARIVEDMETAGVVGPMESNGNRDVLAPPPPKMI